MLHRHHFLAAALLAPLFLASGWDDCEILAGPKEDNQESGRAIYLDRCASCHGEHGEGTPDYPTALTGDKSVLELQKLITETMPSGEPERCVGDEAGHVAEYIYDAFYSVLAQERNRPATIEFSRLTVRQFHHSVADLIATFRGSARWEKGEGLRAQYFNLRSFRSNKRVFDRTDPVVDFNFKEDKPEGFPTEPDDEKRRPDDIHDNKEFSIKWEGSLLAPSTGDYEFIVRSENGVRLYVNDHEDPLFDAWVRSGDQSEYRKSIRLIGGRVYPIRLEFFRYKEKTASVHLLWKPPHGVEEVIPTRNLSPKWSPGFFVLNTPFPPDDASIGYERGSSISRAWEDAVTQAALETAAYVSENVNRLAHYKDKEGDRAQKIREFCERFVERAFRRPLSDAEKSVFVEGPLKDVPPETGVKRVVLLCLMSPRFLYRGSGIGDFDAYDTASWLSYTLWDSLPDQALLDAAKKNELQTADQIGRHVDRMLGDDRTEAKLKEFFHQWLRLDHFPTLVKDDEMYPGFNERLVADLRVSLDLFLQDVLESPESDFRRLLLADEIYMNGRLAEFYGADQPKDADFKKIAFPKEDRAGILTHPLLLSGFAYNEASSPIHRGVFIARSLLGRRLKPPPVAVAPLAPDLHANLSTRERVILQTSPAMCQTCHGMINDLGFSLEHFDATGRYRELEKGKEINAEGGYFAKSGKEVDFVGSRDLAEFLVASPEVHTSFVEQVFQFSVKQPIRAFGDDELENLSDAFSKKNYSVRSLLKEIAVTSAMRVRDIRQKDSTPKATAAR